MGKIELRSFYEILTDEELFTLLPYDRFAEEEFYKRYKKKVVNFLKKYRLKSTERDDLIQEGMIGLFKAIYTFNKELGIKFSTYSKKCIENQIKNALNTMWKYKLNEVFSDEKLDELIEMKNPESKAIEEDYNEMIEKYIEGLDKIERCVLEKFLEGKSYKVIASELEISFKKVDNILSKIRKSLSNYIKQVKKIENN